MHKLVILIEHPDDEAALDAVWPQFLHLAESMPGLRRETTSRVEQYLYGPGLVYLVHELYFDNLEEAQTAMTSPQGRLAGRQLQVMTGGRMTLFFAEHKEDDLENIRKFQEQAGLSGGPA